MRIMCYGEFLNFAAGRSLLGYQQFQHIDLGAQRELREGHPKTPISSSYMRLIVT